MNETLLTILFIVKLLFIWAMGVWTGYSIRKIVENKKTVSSRRKKLVALDPVIHGHWIDHALGFLLSHTTCSRCGFDKDGLSHPNYCEECGAKMDEKVESQCEDLSGAKGSQASPLNIHGRGTDPLNHKLSGEKPASEP